MRIQELFGRRYKEQPAEAFMASHIFLLRGGYVRQVGNGIFSLLPPGRRVTAKIEAIIREEMEAAGAQEVLFPVVLPADLWRESGRFESVGSELMRMKDRAGRELVLGMTHEEAAVHLARSEVQSYSEYPFAIYQIQTKFRDEPRARAGLIRVREFTMKDAYSFHTGQQDLEAYYQRMHEAYERIYRRVGVPVLSVRSDTGMMGGSAAHEFMYLSESGEDTLTVCPACGYRSNLEVACCGVTQPAPDKEAAAVPALVPTPGVADIESLAVFFGVEENRLIKAAVFSQSGTDRPLVVFLRGDYQVNEAKLRALTGREVFPYTGKAEGVCFGYIGPYRFEAQADLIYDVSLQGLEQVYCGGNLPDTHWQGVSVERDIGPASYADVNKVRAGDPCPDCGGPIEVKNGIEAGNIFQLGDKYTRAMDMTYTDRDGGSRHPLMGCYGIGVGRLMSCIMEEHHDANGPVWPVAVAPWQVHICLLGNLPQEAEEFGEALYGELSRTCEVLIDDRNVPAGVQFAEADLLGAPVRVLIGARGWKEGLVELALRDKSVVRKVPVADAAREAMALLQERAEQERL